MMLSQYILGNRESWRVVLGRNHQQFDIPCNNFPAQLKESSNVFFGLGIVGLETDGVAIDHGPGFVGVYN
jgi:hypothetical protein